MQVKLPRWCDMTNPIRTLAERLVASGYAEEMKSIPYGLTRQNTYEIFVEGDGWQNVNPFGTETYSQAQSWALEDYKAMQDALSADD